MDYFSNLMICIIMKEQILNLRSQGKTYPEIKAIVGCSSSTVSYHCGEGQKEKAEQRKRKYLSTLLGILKRKKDNFSFSRGNRKSKGKRVSLSFSSKKFREKIESNPYCYLTGRKIDIRKPKTYHCDHIVPISKGGTCDLNNMGLTCKSANMAKSELMVDEFIELCKEVLIHNGYKISKEG